MKKPRAPAINFGLALLSAALLILIFPDAGITWLAPFALSPLLIALAREPRPLWRFFLGEAAGIVYWFGVCYWIQFVLEVHGGMGRWGGWGTFVLFCVAKALHMAVFSTLAAVLLNTSYAIPAVAALWTGIERTHGTSGFAWLALGNAGIDMPLPMRAAPYVGVYGLSFVFALTGATVALLVLRRGRRQLVWLIAIPALLLLPDGPAPPPARETAAVVQPNMPEETDWTLDAANRERDHLMALSLETALKANAHLIVWPEVPGPIYYYRDPVLREEATRLVRATDAYFLFGTVGETPQGPLNSAVLLRPDGDLVDRYDKIKLVPFGEYIPPFFGWVNRITQEAGDFVPGSRIVVFPVGDHKMGAFICYESAFPHEVRQFVREGAQLLVNVSNDGYFGHSAAREQHLEIARMRAAENRRWLLRVTNDGITASIDPLGRVAQRLPMYRETTAAMAYGWADATTFYSQHGDWFAWGCLLASAVALFFSQWPHYQKPVRPRA